MPIPQTDFLPHFQNFKNYSEHSAGLLLYAGVGIDSPISGGRVVVGLMMPEFISPSVSVLRRRTISYRVGGKD